MEEFQNKAIEETLKFVKEQDKNAYQQLEDNASMKNDVISAIKEAAEEVFKLDRELKDVPDEGAKFILEKNLSQERMDMIKKGLQIPTFKLNLSKSVYDGRYMAYFMKDENTLLKAPHVLGSIQAVDMGIAQQWSSIIVEAIALSLHISGITFLPLYIHQALELVACSITPPIACFLPKFAQSWDAPNASPSKKAQAMVDLLKVIIENDRLYFQVLTCIAQYMSLSQWTKFFSRVTAAVINPIVYGNEAIVIKIAQAIPYDHNFNHKIINIAQLALIRSEFEPTPQKEE
ncbi:uncharacterized protein [Clytia hemisphaerica]|uniref:Uncharacterized protein n=1 Tax=Clytia hemisphaerica TaxID=252671 RepID=A0A7M5WQH3_9CNID